MSKTLVICKTKHVLHNGSLAAERPRIIWHFIYKKTEPNFWKCLLGRACWFVSLSLVRGKCSSQFQGKLGLLWRGRRPAPPRRGAARLAVMQQSRVGKHGGPGQLCPRESQAPWGSLGGGGQGLGDSLAEPHPTFQPAPTVNWSKRPSVPQGPASVPWAARVLLEMRPNQTRPEQVGEEALDAPPRLGLCPVS